MKTTSKSGPAVAHQSTCSHVPTCPPAHAPARAAARTVAAHPEQGWSLLCNGVVLFDDGGALLPDGRALSPTGIWRTGTCIGRSARAPSGHHGTSPVPAGRRPRRRHPRPTPCRTPAHREAVANR